MKVRVWCHTHVTSELRRMRREDHECKVRSSCVEKKKKPASSLSKRENENTLIAMSNYCRRQPKGILRHCPLWFSDAL